MPPGACCIAILLLLWISVQTRPISYYQPTPPPSVAFVFSGAGGRLGQLVALAEALINGTYMTGTPIRPSCFAGASSGAIVAVAMSAILETTEQQVPGITYGEFHDILFNLNNNDIFSSDVYKVIEDLASGYLLDNTPLRYISRSYSLLMSSRNFLSKTLQRVNYTLLGDLYLPTTISTVDQRTGITVRLSSTNAEHATLPILDVLIASASIPLAFKPGSIPALSNYSRFLDGATGIDAVPIIPLLSIPSLQSAYVITFNYAITHGIIDNSHPLDAGEFPLLTYALQAFNIQNANLAIGALGILNEANFSGFVFEPNFTTTFSTIDFGSCEAQYSLTQEWAKASFPLPVHTYDLKPSFFPNYTLIDQELAQSTSPYLTPSLIPATLLCLALFW
jgi:predicted acylesterase/phospholipase RssA